MSGPTTQPANGEQLRDEALCRSVLYGALSLGLHDPTPENCDLLRSDDASLAWLDAVALLMAGRTEETETPETDAPAEDGVDLEASVQAWVQNFPSWTLDSWRAAHGKLFGHAARGLVCPYETEYGQEGLFQQPRQLAEIMGFYQAFGLVPRVAERERADHVSCELEFLDFLCRKEAWGLERDDDALVGETRKAIRLFLKEHLGRFGRAFARFLQEQEGDRFFGRLGDVLADFLTLECRRLGLQPGATVLELRSAEDDQVPMACGEQSELIQLQVPK